MWTNYLSTEAKVHLPVIRGFGEPSFYGTPSCPLSFSASSEVLFLHNVIHAYQVSFSLHHVHGNSLHRRTLSSALLRDTSYSWSPVFTEKPQPNPCFYWVMIRARVWRLMLWWSTPPISQLLPLASVYPHLELTVLPWASDTLQVIYEYFWSHAQENVTFLPCPSTDGFIPTHSLRNGPSASFLKGPDTPNKSDVFIFWDQWGFLWTLTVSPSLYNLPPPPNQAPKNKGTYLPSYSRC